jgi:hypothetical protein
MVVGDWDGDGYTDAMARQGGTGKMWLYPGLPSGGFGAPVGGWSGWATRTLITPVGDFDGDGAPDLMARARNGSIYLYPGRGGGGGFMQRVNMRSSLPGAVSMVGVGRWDSDGAPDVMVRTSSGQLQLYRGNGPGGLMDPVVISRRFSTYDTLVGVGDLNGDGQPDLLGRTPDGDAWLIPGVAPSGDARAGSFGMRQYLASGWLDYRIG